MRKQGSDRSQTSRSPAAIINYRPSKGLGRGYKPKSRRHLASSVAGKVIERGLCACGFGREMREDLCLSSGRVRDLLGRRKMAGRALVFDIRGPGLVIGRLPSDAGLDIGIARRIRHHRCAPARTDRHVFSRWRYKAVVACEAITRVGEHRGVRLRVFLDRSTGARPRSGVRPCCREQDSAQPHRCPEGRSTNQMSETDHFQNSKNPPSNQSHSR